MYRIVRTVAHRGVPACCLTCAVLIGCSQPVSSPQSASAPGPSVGETQLEGGAGEVWITAQDKGEVKILGGTDSIETVALPADAGPHEITFSPSGRYAYVANMGNGDLVVVRAPDRRILATLDLGPSHRHQAKPSPGGSAILVSQMHHQTLVKVAVDERTESWRVAGSLSLAKRPVCTAFRADGQRAYVSLAPNGLAIVDVPTMTLLGTRPTAGGVQCGLVNSKDGRRIFVDSNGEDMAVGHFYVLDTATDQLTLHTAFPASDLHGFEVGPEGKWAYAAERGADRLRTIDLTALGATPGSISLDHDPTAADRPDKVAVKGDDLYVTLRSTGVLARVARDEETVEYIPLVPPSNYAVHGIVVRP